MLQVRWGEVHHKWSPMVQPRARVERRGHWIDPVN